MNVLALHTATQELIVAAESEAGRFLLAAKGKQQAAELLPFMEEATDNAGFTLKETQLVTAAQGPGAFTGLRLAYSAAKAVQLASGCPFIPVPTFDACAENLRHCGGLVLCVMDAKKKRFYAQFFRSGRQESEILDASPEEIALLAAEKLNSGNTRANAKTLILTGPDAQILAEHADFAAALRTGTQEGGDTAAPLVVPTANGAIFSMIFLSKQLLPHYNGTKDSYCTGPLYIRKSDAEVFHG